MELCSKQWQRSSLLHPVRLPYSNFSGPWGLHVRAGESVRDYAGSLKLNHFWPHSLARTKTNGPNSAAQDIHVESIQAKGNQGSGILRQSLLLLPLRSPEFHFILPKLVRCHTNLWLRCHTSSLFISLSAVCILLLLQKKN